MDRTRMMVAVGVAMLSASLAQAQSYNNPYPNGSSYVSYNGMTCVQTTSSSWMGTQSQVRCPNGQIFNVPANGLGNGLGSLGAVSPLSALFGLGGLTGTNGLASNDPTAGLLLALGELLAVVMSGQQNGNGLFGNGLSGNGIFGPTYSPQPAAPLPPGYIPQPAPPRPIFVAAPAPPRSAAAPASGSNVGRHSSTRWVPPPPPPPMVVSARRPAAGGGAILVP